MVIRTVSEIVFACHTSACRPPTSGGTGGSSASGGAKKSARGGGGGLVPGHDYSNPRSFPGGDGKPLGKEWGWANPNKREYGQGVTGKIKSTKDGKYEASLVETKKVSGVPLLIGRGIHSTHRAAQDYLDKQGNAALQLQRFRRKQGS